MATAEDLDRTFEAVVLDWEDALRVSPGRSGVALRARLRALCTAGVTVVVVTASTHATLRRQLRLRADWPGRLWLWSHLEPGLVEHSGDVGARLGLDPLSPVKDDPLAATASVLYRLGIGTGLILAIGGRLGAGPPGTVTVAPSPQPPTRGRAPGRSSPVIRLLDDQRRRRGVSRVPSIDEDAGWTIRETTGDPLRFRVVESLFTLGSGGVGTRGAVEEHDPRSRPLVLAAGVYDADAAQRLLPLPEWTGLDLASPVTRDVRVLDLRTGCLARTERRSGSPPLRTLRFHSITVPGVAALRAEAATGRLHPGPAFRAPAGGRATTGRLGARHWARAAADGLDGVAAVAGQRVRRDGALRTVERIAAYVPDTAHSPRITRAAELLDAAERIGFDQLLADQRESWARRWDVVDVRIPDDSRCQLAIRYALFQLWANSAAGDELAVGARGLSGPGYDGHVFWDADAYVLPAMASIDPSVAEAMVEYRLARLPAARARAAHDGYDGARLPWESARDGSDVTPRTAVIGGEQVHVLTGQQEEHITADVAWAALYQAQWNGRRPAELRRLNPLLADTARYWASRVEQGDDGRLHIRQVIGPDEYHDRVDDNAYTNVMARWNLRAAAAALADDADAATEVARWRDVADRLVDGYDPTTGIYEQFAGFHRLEDMRVADIGHRPVAADILLGQARVARTQLIKQPDVLMLHHLVPDEVAPGSLAANLDHYDPRTAYGSSLAPTVTASLLARAGRPDDALELLRFALSLDLDDATGTTASGLHLANLAGVWQTVICGFLGARVRGGVLHLEPRLPHTWRTLEVRFRCLRTQVRVAVFPDRVDVTCDGTLRVRMAGRPARDVRRAASFPRPPG